MRLFHFLSVSAWTASVFASQLRSAEIRIVLANDTSIEYSPATSDSSVWVSDTYSGDQDDDGEQIFRTSHVSAILSFNFTGGSLQLSLSSSRPNEIAPLNITIDEQSQIATASAMTTANNDPTTWSYMPHTVPNFDSSANHTVTLQRANEKSLDEAADWALVFYSFEISVPDVASPLAPSSLQVTNPTQGASQSLPSKKSVKSGVAAGVAVGSVCALGFAGLLLLCRLRRRKTQNLEPDPLVIIPESSRQMQQQSGLRRFPLFSAPLSVWPTSQAISSIFASSSERRRRQDFRGGSGNIAPSNEKHTPFQNSPNPPNQLRVERERHRTLGSLFVANPSDHSDRSIRSLSLLNMRTAPTTVPISLKPGHRIEPELLTFKGDSAVVAPIPKRATVEEKKREADFEIESQAPPPRTGKSSISNRRFFTANPNPTSSSTSSSSSRAMKGAKKAADFVRTTVRHLHPSDRDRIRPPRQLPATPQTFQTTPRPCDTGVIKRSRPSIAAKIPTAPAGPRPPPTDNSHSKRKRQSQTIFYTTNPNPSAIGMDSAPDAPRIDKGKQRADV